jgi:hypothetical protein
MYFNQINKANGVNTGATTVVHILVKNDVVAEGWIILISNEQS